MLLHVPGPPRAQRLHGEIAVFLHVVDRRAVHHDHRQIQHRAAHLRGNEGRSVLAHQADLRAVLAEIVQPELRGGGNGGKAVWRKILHAHEKHKITVFCARQAKNVHRDGRGGAEQHAEHPVGRLAQRVVDLREGDDDADEHDRREACGVGHAQQHGGVEREHHAQRHHGIEQQHIRADGRENQHQQQEQQTPGRADQRSGKAVDGVVPGVAHIGLHADDGGDGGLRGHILPAVAAQIVKQQAQEHRDGGFDDALADHRQMKMPRSVAVGFLLHRVEFPSVIHSSQAARFPVLPVNVRAGQRMRRPSR